jgi:hypothetical protein
MRAHIVLRRMRNCTWCKRRGQFKPKKKGCSTCLLRAVCLVLAMVPVDAPRSAMCEPGSTTRGAEFPALQLPSPCGLDATLHRPKTKAFLCLPYGIGVFLARSRPSALFFAIPCVGSYCRHENEAFGCDVAYVLARPKFWRRAY